MKTIYFLLISTFFCCALFAEQPCSFAKVQEEVKYVPYWTYPYPQITSYLKQKNKTSLLIFSYGSLMDPASAEYSLSQKTLATIRPAVAFGLRRLFDRDVPIKETSKWGIPNDSNARGMLNVSLSDRPEDFINGVLIDVTLEDIPCLIQREQEYDLLPIIAQSWDTTTDTAHPHYLLAYTFYTPQGKQSTSATILPRPGYYELTRNAALLYGHLFYQIWLKTTYLADGITSITDWEQKVQTGDCSALKRDIQLQP